MRSAFEWPSGDRREYLTGDVEIPGTADGDQYEALTGGLDQTVRGVRLRIVFGAIFEETTGSARVASRIWIDLLRGEELAFYPDAERPESVVVKPDLGHEFSFFERSESYTTEYKTLKMVTRDRLDVSHPIFDFFADVPTIQ